MGIGFCYIIYVHISVLQLVIGVEQKIAEEHFQEFSCGVNAFLQIVIVRSYERVTEIPRILLKGIVIHTETKGFHIFDHKDGGCSRVTLAKGMNLPDARCEFCEVSDGRFYRQTLVGKLLFGCKIVVQSVTNTIEIRVNYGIAVEYPFLLGDVVRSDLTCVLEYALEQSAVNGHPLRRRELKALFAEELCDSCRNDISFFGRILDFGALDTLLVVALNALLRLVNTDVTLDVSRRYSEVVSPSTA